MTAALAALVASVKEAHWSPYDMATRHTVWIDRERDGFAVRCIPHGEVGWKPTGLAATALGYAHDDEQGEVSW
jgi:hypothetical protein